MSKSFLSGIGKVASVAAPFIPGIGAPIAAGVGALTSGLEADGKAKQYEGQINSIAQGQTAGFNQYYAPLLEAYARQLGYDSGTNSFDGQGTGTGNHVADSNAARIKELTAQRAQEQKNFDAYARMDKQQKLNGSMSVSPGTNPSMIASMQKARTNKMAEIDKELSSLQSAGDRTPTTPSGATNAATPYGEVSQTPYGAIPQTNFYGAVSQTPFGEVSATPYGDASENSYTGNYGTQRYNETAQQLDTAADQATAQIGADSLNRGFVGHNTSSQAQEAAVRVAEGQNLANTKADLLRAGNDESYRRNGLNVDESYRRNVANNETAWNRNTQNTDATMNWDARNTDESYRRNALNVDEQNRRIAQFMQMLSGNASGALPTLSSLGGMYTSQSNQMGNGLGQLAGLIGNSGGLGGTASRVGTPPFNPIQTSGVGSNATPITPRTSGSNFNGSTVAPTYRSGSSIYYS